jgi:hypothetical protein
MQRRHRRVHAAIWTSLAVAVPLLLAIIFASAPKRPADAPAIRLDDLSAGGGKA